MGLGKQTIVLYVAHDFPINLICRSKTTYFSSGFQVLSRLMINSRFVNHTHCYMPGSANWRLKKSFSAFGQEVLVICVLRNADCRSIYTVEDNC